MEAATTGPDPSDGLRGIKVAFNIVFDIGPEFKICFPAVLAVAPGSSLPGAVDDGLVAGLLLRDRLDEVPCSANRWLILFQSLL